MMKNEKLKLKFTLTSMEESLNKIIKGLVEDSYESSHDFSVSQRLLERLDPTIVNTLEEIMIKPEWNN